MKSYQLPIARNYCRDWTYIDAIRELLQNAIDGGEWDYSFGPGTLQIFSPSGSLDPSTLLLGTTSKAEDARSIGQFGEGYKIALLVLARSGLAVSVEHSNVCWMPAFRRSETFDAEVLCIDETPCRCDGITFTITGLTREQQLAVKDSCLHLQQDIGETISTTRGQILLDQPGELYINGLFVCKTQAKFGYDVKPAHLKLERDRQTVGGFDLQWLLKEMWFETKQWDRIAALISGEAFDTEYAQHGAPIELNEACARLFERQQPGKTIAASPQEVSSTPTSVYYSRTMHACVSAAPSYRIKLAKPKTPADLLQDWLEVNKKHMRHRGVKAFSQLVKDAKNWSR